MKWATGLVAVLVFVSSAQATETPSGHRDCRGEPINIPCIRTFTAHRGQRTWTVRDRPSAGVWTQLAVPTGGPAPNVRKRYRDGCLIHFLHWQTLRVQVREFCDDPDEIMVRYSAATPTHFQFRFTFLNGE